MIKKLPSFLLLVVAVVGLYFNWTHWHQPIIGVLALILYYAITAIAWGRIVERVLPLDRNWSRFFGFLVAFYLSAMTAGISVVVWKYDRLAVAGAMLAVGLVGVLLSLRAKRSGAKQSQNQDGIASSPAESAGFLAMTWKNWHFILLAILSALFVFYVIAARTGVYILSPWDTLSSFTLMLFFVITFLVGLLVLSNRPAKVILVVLIAFSYLTHLYLPVVYETGFGGDKWRHLAASRWLQQGNIYIPSVWGQEPRSTVNFGPLAVPEALVAGNKTSYSAQWSVTIMLAESLQVDVFWVDLLLVFLLWSLFLPLILYQFGIMLSPPARGGVGGVGAERLGLLLAFLPALFYTFQSEGAITLPVSFGHLFFFFVLLFWLYYIKEGKRSTLMAAGVLSLFFYWGYILNFLVLIGVGVLAMAWRKIHHPLTPSLVKEGELKTPPLLYSGGGRGVVLFGLLVIISVLSIPFLEIFQGLSQYSPETVSWAGLVNALADAMGRLLGYVGVIVPPDYIDQGNFLFNQSGESLSRLPVFSYQLIPFVVSSLVWMVIMWGVYRLIKMSLRGSASDRGNLNFARGDGQIASPSARNDMKALLFLSIIFFIALTSYFISWSFTTGVHVLARRLNETIVFFMILFLGYGVWLFIRSAPPSFTKEGVGGWSSRISTRKKILALCFILAFGATATYASGPKLQLVTTDELKAAKLVWSELKNESPPYCVIANTWPLLGLEAESGRQITVGGFPVYNEYAQPERVKIFEMLSKKPSKLWFEGAFRITGANVCYYMNEKRWISDFVFADTVKLLGEPRREGTVYIWKIENRRTVFAGR